MTESPRPRLALCVSHTHLSSSLLMRRIVALRHERLHSHTVRHPLLRPPLSRLFQAVSPVSHDSSP